MPVSQMLTFMLTNRSRSCVRRITHTETFGTYWKVCLEVHDGSVNRLLSKVAGPLEERSPC